MRNKSEYYPDGLHRKFLDIERRAMEREREYAAQEKARRLKDKRPQPLKVQALGKLVEVFSTAHPERTQYRKEAFKSEDTVNLYPDIQARKVEQKVSVPFSLTTSLKK
jgi:hypothetical protein